MKYSEFLEVINTDNEDLRAVRRNGRALEFINHQTPEICLAAVRENGLALEYARHQTPEICLAAVGQNPNALQFVDKSIFEPE